LAALLVASLLPLGCRHLARNASSEPALPPPIARTAISRAHERPGTSRTPTDPLAAAKSPGASLAIDVRPLGFIPFDSVTLPLVAMRSVEGRREYVLAAQVGATPTWPALLADGTPEDSSQPRGLQIVAFRASADAGPSGRDRRSLEAIAWQTGLSRGLLLGRSCDERGFLVEWPRHDGSRWIGRVDWSTGAEEWLADSRATVNAFATLGPDGSLAYSRRNTHRADSAAPAFELVVRSAGGSAESERVLALPGVSLVFPCFSADADVVYVLGVGEQPGARLRVFAVNLALPGEGQAPGALRIAGESSLDVEASIASAFQTTLCIQTPWPGPRRGPLSRGIALMSGETASMAWIDPSRSAVIPLAGATVGAVPFFDPLGAGAKGLLLGAASDLVFQAVESGDAAPKFAREASVWRGGFVPRVVGDENRPRYILFSPPLAGASEQTGVYELRPEEVHGLPQSGP
jgi:hypothetical protein